MYINELIKKQLKSFAALLIFLILTIFITSYAIFKRSTSDTEVQSVSMGDLNIVFYNANGGPLSSADAIILNDSNPMSDANGLTNENNLYTFVINNNGSLAYEYTISLIDNPDYLEGGVYYDEDISLLDHDYIRANLLGIQSGNAFTNETFTLGSKANDLIYTNIINPGESQQYTLRLWVADPDSFYVPNEVIGEKAYLNIKVEGYAGSGTKTYDFAYTGSEQIFTAPKSGYYKIEAWGASGGGDKGGNGAYTSGIVSLNKMEKLYIYVGEKGKDGTAGINATSTVGQGAKATYNGGGAGGNAGGGDYPYANYYGGVSGGGATDVRFLSDTPTEADLLWNSSLGLKSRIIVSGGGGGNVEIDTTYSPTNNFGHSGGLTGTIGNAPNSYASKAGISGNQTTGYSFGIGGKGDNTGAAGYCNGHNGGGGGYYGGGGGLNSSGSCHRIGGGGGSSFISGHTGCVAISSSSSTTPRTGTSGGSCTTGTSDNLCSVHYSGKTFINTIMIDGAGYSWTNVKGALTQMPNPNGGYYGSGVGHIGNGYAKITYIRPINENEYEYSYTGSEQTFTAPKTGTYKVELWGASGGGQLGGKGAYTSGLISLNSNEQFSIFVGGAGNSSGNGGFNGGGNAGVLVINNDGGGGATDIRINTSNIYSRIIVAAGGGGANADGSNAAGVGVTGGTAGGLSGYAGTSVIVNMFGGGASQVAGGTAGFTNRSKGTDGTFANGGIGGTSKNTPTVSGGAGGGGGYYGGGSGEGCHDRCGGSGGGGSSFISGHTGCVSITSSSSTSPRTGTDGASCDTGTSDNLCSVHYSGKTFTNTVMIDGAGYAWTNVKGALTQMPTPFGGYYGSGVGHTGNGFAKITYLSE